MQKKLLDEKFEYYTKGDNPKLLIHSGTHGDEYESIEFVKESIEKYQDKLPNYIFVPEVSPSAVKNRTRHNHRDEDTNRTFFDDSDNHEIAWNQQIIGQEKFLLAVSFHEDPEYTNYYIYDEGHNSEKTDLVVKHNSWLASEGIELLNGYDDPKDPALGVWFNNGYRRFTFEKSHDSGMVMNWAMHRHLVQHAMIPEIPGLSELHIKKKIIDSFFQQVIIPYFQVN